MQTRVVYPVTPVGGGSVSYVSTTETQNILLDVMSPSSPYVGTLLTFQVGKGKTYAAAALAHTYIEQGFYVLYASHTVTSTRNFYNEYMTFTVDNRLSPASNNELVCVTFAKLYNMIIKKTINTRYGLVIIDEAHNLREGKQRFRAIHDEINKWRNFKLLLISATPMVDSIRELEVLRSFIQFDARDPSRPLYILHSQHPSSSVNMQYIGIDTESTRLYITIMKGEQRDVYLQLANTHANSIDSYRRQASLTVPNINFALPLREQACKLDAIISLLRPGELSVVFSFFKVRGVYALASALDATNEFARYKPGLVNSTHTGATSAMDLNLDEEELSSDLEQELELCNLVSSLNSKRERRYAIITGSTPPREAAEVLSRFTSIENRNGKFIELLIGTSVISESISLRELRHVHVLHPFWNYGPIHQTIGRAMRMNSHTSKDTTMNIYLHASVAAIDSTISDDELLDAVRIGDTSKYKSSDLATWHTAWKKEKSISSALSALPTIDDPHTPPRVTTLTSVRTPTADELVAAVTETQNQNRLFSVPEPNNCTVFADAQLNRIYDLRKCIEYTPSKIAWARFAPEHAVEYDLDEQRITYSTVPRNLVVYTPPPGYSIWVSAADRRERITYISPTSDKRRNKRGKLLSNVTRTEIHNIATELGVPETINGIRAYLKRTDKYFEQLSLK